MVSLATKWFDTRQRKGYHEGMSVGRESREDGRKGRRGRKVEWGEEGGR